MRKDPFVVALALVWTLGACGGSGGKNKAPPLPHVALTPDVEFVPVAVGKPFTLTATLTNDDGSPATGYKWEWQHTDAIEKWTLETSSPSPGVEKVTFRPPGKHAVSQIWAHLTTCGASESNPCFSTNEADTDKTDVVVWGGPATRIDTAVDEVRLLVSEARPLGAVAAASTSSGVWYSDDLVTYTSAGATIATVDGDGVIRGVAAGDTTVTVTAGAVHVDVPVHVAAGKPGPMPDGLAPLVSKRLAWALMPDLGTSHKSVAYSVALSATDGPYFISSMLNGETVGATTNAGTASRSGGTQTARISLARWTGSGFGFEALGDPFDANIQPMVALDERGKRYVVYRSGNRRSWVVTERDANAASSTTRLRELPREIAEAKALGGRPRDYLWLTNPDIPRGAIVPRKGGGLWVAYELVADYGNSPLVSQIGEHKPLAAPCAIIGVLAEVTDAAVNARQIGVGYYEPGISGCSDGPDWPDFLLLTPDPEGGPPVTHFGLGDNPETGDLLTSAAFQADGGPKYIGAGAGYGGFELGGRALSVSKEGLVWVTPQDEMGALPNTPQLGAGWGDSVWPELGIFVPNHPALNLVHEFRGWGHDATRFVGVYQGGEADKTDYSLSINQLKRGLLWNADEAAGRRFSVGINSPGIADPPVVLPDGTRYFLSRHIGACKQDQKPSLGLWRSAGPGARPELVTASGTELRHSAKLQAAGTTLYTIDEGASGTTMGFSVRKSTDGGATWTDASAYTGQPLASHLRAWGVLPNGAAFAAMATDLDPAFSLMTTPNVATGSWTAIPGWNPTLQATEWGVFWGGNESFGFAPTLDGANMWAVVAAHGNGRNGVYARLLSPAGGVVNELLVELKPAGGMSDVVNPLANTAVVAGNGSVVVLGRELAGSEPRYGLSAAAINPTTKVAAVTPLTAHGAGRVVPLVRLGDGRLVAGAQLSEIVGVKEIGFDARRDRAVLWSSSADLSTWSAPKVLRPDGGNGQVVWSLGLDGDGKLLSVVGDNGTFETGELVDEYYFAHAAPSCPMAKLMAGIMRPDAP